MSDYITKAQCERIRVHAIRTSNDDAIERCARILLARYCDAELAIQMTRGMADGERAKALNREFCLPKEPQA